MVQKSNAAVISYGCVYQVTFPDGRIYVGSDTAQTAELNYYKYMGSPSLGAQKAMHANIAGLLGPNKSLTVTKVVLYESRDCTIGHILEMERVFIKKLDATNPNVGYNRC